MKQFFTPLIGFALAISANAKTIFTSSLDSQEEFSRWTVVDNNKDDKTWQFSASNDSGKRTYYSYHSTNQGDDWLISPAITATTAGNYLITYSYEGGTSYPEAMKVYTGAAADIATLTGGLQKDYTAVTGKNADYFFVKLEAGQSFYLAFQACSQPDMFRLFVRDVEVKMCNNPVDLALTEITSPTSAEGLTNSEKITLKVANNGLSAAAAGSSSVTITIDGEEKFTETINQEIAVGQEISITLNTPVDLSISHHTYSVTATVNNSDDISNANNSLSASIRHIGPAVEPYTMGFENSEDTSDIKFINVNEDSGYWSIQTDGWFVAPSRTGVRSMCYNYSKENQADDWAILDGIQMAAGHHVLKYWVSTMDDSHKESYSIWWGNEASVSGMKNKIAEYTDYTGAAYTKKIVIFELTEPQTVYIGFHATSAANQNWIAIDDISINSISATDVDIAVSDLTNPGEYLVEKQDKNIKFNVMNQGIVDIKATINIDIDDQNVYSKEETLVAQDDKTFTISDILDTLKDGKHTIKVNVYNADEKDTSDNTLESSFIKLGAAPLAWDFEDGVVPEEFTVRSEDSYTLADGAKEGFGETGVCILDIEKHQYYGEHMLGMTCWFTEAGYADRWVVLPQVHVDSEDSYFVWNVGSLDANYDEKYSIEVSAGSDYWTNYDKAVTIAQENYVRKNRGISLASYYGKDVYIALHLTTYDGYAIAFDNLGLYGCTAVSAGVKDVVKSDLNVNFAGDMLNLDEAANVNVYDLNGRSVLCGKGTSFNLSNLTKGAYIVKVTTAEGTVTKKFIR
jgi:hypothetical protein